MAAYATVADVEARWRVLDTSEQATAEALLDDAAVYIRAACPDVDQRIADGTLDPDIPKIISVSMVKRAMASMASGFEGITQLQQTAGPFTQNTTLSNPSGNMWLTKNDRRLLGCPIQKAFSVDMAPDAVWPNRYNTWTQMWTETYGEA